jgi:single-stranded-DNA-specific exonuclease
VRTEGLPPVAKSWHLLPHEPTAVGRLARALDVSAIVAQLLLNRNVCVPEQAKRFLEAPLTGLHPPELLPGAAEAAQRLFEAARSGRRICVYGDYDVDGTTGTAILLQGLRLLGAEPDFYVPHRLEEGYGLNPEALRQIADSGARVVVTVDCGVASLREAEVARDLGLELIVTDHHEPKERRPDAAVVVHPRLPPGAYPFGGLSGSGVAFKLAWKLAQLGSGSDKVTPRFRDYLLDAVVLASLGTIADVVPLHDENRIFVRAGLNRLRQAPSLGLKALIEAAGLRTGAELRASDVAFKLAPRLNAAGRLGCARLVVELLTTTSPQRALDQARFLEQQNSERQTIERHMVKQARDLAERDFAAAPALVLASPDWHGGVIGIVAGRLAEQYARPVLMIAVRPADNGGLPVGHGSGRSVPGFALHEALKACGDCLISHGGHHSAAGFKVRADAIDTFRERFCAYTASQFPEGPPGPRLVLDAELPLSALTMGLLKEIDRLEPYGSENNRPIFLAGDLEIQGQPRRMGGGERHMSFRVRQNGTTLRAVAFGMGDRFDELLSDGGRCCLAFTPKINEWQGYTSVELEVVDFRPGSRAPLT